MTKKRIIFFGLFVFICLGLVAAYLYFFPAQTPLKDKQKVVKSDLVTAWEKLSQSRQGKVVFAQPPKMLILHLHSGDLRDVPGVVVAGGSGRIRRGFSPRPSWSPDGDRFLYRYNKQVFVCDEAGKKRVINNPLMDRSKETRWSWWAGDGYNWAVGPSVSGNVIMVRIDNPAIVRTIHSGENVQKHCELTGTGEYLVYAAKGIFVKKNGSSGPGKIISRGQNCRPCAAPDNRVAWLPAPHTRYLIHDAETGKLIQEFFAPKGEQIYRLNWSNLPDFAVHMFGSRGNDRIHVRRVSTSQSLFVGHGWDPDLWVGNSRN